jgi:pyruvate dehydrogenase E2 component (dihydrolipoamide acetyltransferase)
MPKQIRMPKLSDTMEEGTLIAWRKSPGDPIRRGEILADIETDKADMEFESYTEGTIHSFLIEPGACVPVGTLIAIIQLPGESAEDVEATGEAAAVAPQPAAVAPRPQAAPSGPAAAPSVPAPVTPAPVAAAPAPVGGPRVVTPFDLDADRLRATPHARQLAEERSVDLEEIEGSGPAGAILVGDILTYLQQLEAQTEEAEGVRATPLALRMAPDLGVDLESVKGSGPGGRVTKSDLLAHVERAESLTAEREAELFSGALQLSQKRRALIRNMVKSKEEAPHFYLEMDVQTDALGALRKRVNEESGSERPRLTYTHLMVKAAAMALEACPEVNATYRANEQQIALYEGINIGVAVDVQDELVAPTVKSCQGKTVFQLAEETNALIQRARMRKLQPQDYADGTFTISNLGMFGVDRFYAIITPPQSCILSVSAMSERPLVRDGQLGVGSMTTLGLSVDHRVLDGVKAAKFLGELRRLLEQPEELVSDDPVHHP